VVWSRVQPATTLLNAAGAVTFNLLIGSLTGDGRGHALAAAVIFVASNHALLAAVRSSAAATG
jgi:hypothetical protein